MRNLWLAFLLVFSPGLAPAQEKYQKPPKEILDVLRAPATPQVTVSPARDALLLLEALRYPPIAELAEPMLRLAGLRINPASNSPHGGLRYVALTLQKLAGGSEMKLALPANARLGTPAWSPDGKRFAFTNETANGVELWVGNTATGAVRRLPGVSINAAYAFSEGPGLAAAVVSGAHQKHVQWMPDSRTLLVELVPADRARPPSPPAAPAGPTVQESHGVAAGAWTFEDLLKNPYDETLFDYYATSQLAFVDAATGVVNPVGEPAIFETVRPAPDGRHLLVARVHRPYSYLYPHSNFPKEVEVWDRGGKVVYKLASLGLADSVPTDGVPTGPRSYQWRPTEPATLVWVEALDNGDPKQKAPYRDRILMLQAPFQGRLVELVKTEQRFAGLEWGEKDGLALVSDYERAKRWRRTFLVNADHPVEEPRLVWSRDIRDHYRDPGNPVLRTLGNGHLALLENGGFIYLAGAGASPEGDRPFLDRFNPKTLQRERLFRSDSKSYEVPVALLDDQAARFLTRYESPSEPPNYYLRGSSGRTAMTKFTDPAPQLRTIRKQLVRYQRADGVELSFTLYLPPGYQEGTRLPTVMWAYPLEYDDPATAGQVVGSTERFTTIAGPSHLFFLLRGYAVLDNASLPVIGGLESANNTYIEQIVAGARAAIGKAVAMGVTDSDRVGVGGHSYGAFMAANLLAHSNLFRAGIARSGAYNRTLTPFGFQSERRTLWEAPEIYWKMSPFIYADKIKDPILMIHGEADNNSGTFPIQSERLYQAIRGNRGTVRLVMLPHEAHGYAARESIEHTLYEMIAWFDQYVKNAGPRSEKTP